LILLLKIKLSFHQ